MLVLDMQAMKKYLDHGYRIVKPFVNYALGWLSPELLGTGFNIKSASDTRMLGLIPYSKFNCDSQAQIHLGLVTNSALELIRQMLSRHLGHSAFQIENCEINLNKENAWNKSLQLLLQLNEVDFDQFCVELQKNDKASFLFEVGIQKGNGTANHKMKDKIQFNLMIRSLKFLT